MSAFLVIASIVILLLWFAGVGFCLFRFMDAIDDYSSRRRTGIAMWFCALILWIAVPSGYVVAHLDDDDEHPDRVCLHGHQEWVVTSNGKTTSRVKTWVCETWETR